MTRVNALAQKSQTLHQRIVSGSFILIWGAGLMTAVNLGYNVVVARFLGPGGYGQATVVYTLLTLLSAVTLAFQIVSTKLVAQQESPANKAAIYRIFHRGAWACGIAVGVFLLAFQKGIAGYLNLPQAELVAIMAVGAAF